MKDDTQLYNLSRRKVLGGLGAVGLASAGAGLGTSAYFSDTESFTGNTLTAGSLDLKVDWEEHYYDGSAGGEYVAYEEPENLAEYIGLPDPDDPQVWVDVENLDAFMSSAAIEAFPDPDDDGSQETKTAEWIYNACTDGADLDSDLGDWEGPAKRTQNKDTYDSETGTPKPLVSLDDVKPGDFGELTLSFHLCDNPGYVWMQGMLDQASENGVMEPEAAVDGDGVELLDEIETVMWYDARGDNVLRTDCGVPKLFLIDSKSGSNTPSTLFEVDLSGTDAELTELVTASGGNFNQTDAIAVTPNADAVIFYDKSSGHLGEYDIGMDQFNDVGPISGDPGGVVLAGYSPGGELWAASQDTDHLYVVNRSPLSVTDMGDTGIDLQGADLVFASDGTLYIWSSADSSSQEGLWKVDDPSSDTTATLVGPNLGDIPDLQVTGIAIEDGGTGDLLVSDTDGDEIHRIDRSTGTIVDTWPMTLGGESYAYDFGDMDAANFCGEVFYEGTLRDALSTLASGDGIPLDGDRYTPFDEMTDPETAPNRECFASGVNHYVGFAWWLPAEVGNEVQSDSVAFDLGFYTEQCRHNDGSGPSTATATTTTEGDQQT